MGGGNEQDKDWQHVEQDSKNELAPAAGCSSSGSSGDAKASPATAPSASGIATIGATAVGAAAMAASATSPAAESKAEPKIKKCTLHKARNWTAAQHNVPVYDDVKMDGAPVGYLAEGTRIICMNRDMNDGQALKHEKGFSNMLLLRPDDPAMDAPLAGFSTELHSRCCNGAECERVAWLIWSCVVITTVGFIMAVVLGYGFVQVNHDLCPDFIQSGNGLLQKIFSCDVTHKDWTRSNVEYKWRIDSISSEIRKTWDPAKLESLRPFTVDKYFDNMCTSRKKIDKDLKSVLDEVENLWDMKRQKMTPYEFVNQMCQEHHCPKAKEPEPCPKVKEPEPCPKCKEPEPCPTTCPICPVRYSSAVPQTTPANGFCAPCPTCPKEKSCATTSHSSAHDDWDDEDEEDEYGTPSIDDHVFIFNRLRSLYQASLQPVIPTVLFVKGTIPTQQAMASSDGKHIMVMQDDCNLVVYKEFTSRTDPNDKNKLLKVTGTPTWASNTDGKGKQCTFHASPRAIRVLNSDNKIVWERVQKYHEFDIRSVRVTANGPEVMTT